MDEPGPWEQIMDVARKMYVSATGRFKHVSHKIRKRKHSYGLGMGVAGTAKINTKWYHHAGLQLAAGLGIPVLLGLGGMFVYSKLEQHKQEKTLEPIVVAATPVQEKSSASSNSATTYPLREWAQQRLDELEKKNLTNKSFVAENISIVERLSNAISFMPSKSTSTLERIVSSTNDANPQLQRTAGKISQEPVPKKYTTNTVQSILPAKEIVVTATNFNKSPPKRTTNYVNTTLPPEEILITVTNYNRPPPVRKTNFVKETLPPKEIKISITNFVNSSSNKYVTNFYDIPRPSVRTITVEEPRFIDIPMGTNYITNFVDTPRPITNTATVDIPEYVDMPVTNIVTNKVLVKRLVDKKVIVDKYEYTDIEVPRFETNVIPAFRLKDKPIAVYDLSNLQIPAQNQGFSPDKPFQIPNYDLAASELLTQIEATNRRYVPSQTQRPVIVKATSAPLEPSLTFSNIQIAQSNSRYTNDQVTSRTYQAPTQSIVLDINLLSRNSQTNTQSYTTNFAPSTASRTNITATTNVARVLPANKSRLPKVLYNADSFK